MEKFRWHVGVHPKPSCVGAVRFARWLHTAAGDRNELHGVYCVSALRAVHRITMASGPDMSEHRRTLERFVARFECREAFSTLQAIAGAPEYVLRRVVADYDGDGILLGRSSIPTDIISLGAVGRRLLRKAPVPVVVVPPDLEVDPIGRGPVVAAVTPRPDSVAALHFARDFAAAHGLELRCVHVLATEDTADEDPGLLRDWFRDQGLAEPPLTVARGPVGATVIEHATEASLIVCGSRKLSLFDRILSSSRGSLIAAHASRPVAVVPPN